MAALLRNLDARYYVDADIFEAERQSIFRRHWQMLGPVSRLENPGDYVAADIAGWKLFALRGGDGRLRAFHNVCRHRGARLLPDGRGKTQLLRCPYHQWVYEQNGALRDAPWFGEDPCFNAADWPLEQAQLAEWRGLLFIAIDPAVGLIEQLGDLPPKSPMIPSRPTSMLRSGASPCAATGKLTRTISSRDTTFRGSIRAS